MRRDRTGPVTYSTAAAMGRPRRLEASAASKLTCAASKLSGKSNDLEAAFLPRLLCSSLEERTRVPLARARAAVVRLAS